MAGPFDELKKLSPQERIKHLKEIEEERQKEIEQAEELIKETVNELAAEAEEKRKIPIPQARATDISSVLATAEEKQIVATHHLLSSEAAVTTTSAPSQPQQQQRSLEEVAAEAATPQQQAQQQQLQLQGFQKPVYAIGTEQQRSAAGEYISKSLQTVTGGGGTGSQIEEKITEFYRERAVEAGEPREPQQKYFGTHQQVTGGYEVRKTEEEERKQQADFYRRRGGPA